MIVQGSPEWHQARLGKVTASKVADVMARTKSGYAATRANYAAQLIIERLTGQPTECFTNDAMRWGTEKEPEARRAYAFRTDNDVTEVGFVDHPVISLSGASPDGLIGDDGLLEIKCPNTATHLDTLQTGAPPSKYVSQMQWQMASTGRQWCDFVSYDPRLPEDFRIFIARVERDDETIAQMETEVVAFLAEIDARINELNARYSAQMKDAA